MDRELKKIENKIASLNNLIDFLYTGGEYTLYFNDKIEILEVLEGNYDPENDKNELKKLDLFSNEIIAKYGDNTNDFLFECEKILEELEKEAQERTNIINYTNEYFKQAIEEDYILYNSLNQ